ncbi:MAG: hypothetical protein WBF17_10000 [Phycisphaerae bacterium]
MSPEMNRRTFIKGSLAASPVGTLALAAAGRAAGKDEAARTALPKGRIGKLEVSRLLLGGNLLTHYTHSRDLKYVYNLAAHYNTEAKILETLAAAEAHGVDTLVVHFVPKVLRILADHRKRGGKIKWIICPAAGVDEGMKAYSQQLQELADMGCEAIYLWGVRADALTAAGKVDLLAKAVGMARDHALPSGVGAHDLRVIQACEKNKVPADFYIKTLHHHNYPSGPKADELKGPTREIPGYWCEDPKAVVAFMKSVAKPWIAFKVMAAGAIPPQNAFQYAFASGADHVLAGMFDFEIAEDAAIARKVLAGLKRSRPWRS